MRWQRFPPPLLFAARIASSFLSPLFLLLLFENRAPAVYTARLKLGYVLASRPACFVAVSIFGVGGREGERAEKGGTGRDQKEPELFLFSKNCQLHENFKGTKFIWNTKFLSLPAEVHCLVLAKEKIPCSCLLRKQRKS